MTTGIIILAFLIVGALLLGAVAGLSGPSAAREPSPVSLEPGQLLIDDQLEALKRYGVREDFERAADQGVDLRALGYEPPGDG